MSAQEVKEVYKRLVDEAEVMARRYFNETGVLLDPERAMWAVLAYRTEQAQKVSNER